MIIVDVEGSGTEPTKHSIVSVGAIDFDKPERQFYEECRIWDGAHVMKEALAVNGFTDAQIRDPGKKSEAELAQGFLAFAMDAKEQTLAGQNVSYDRDFLKHACERAGLDWPLAFRTIDTHTLAYMHMVKRDLSPPLSHNRSALDLDAILNYCGIPKEPHPHNALTGAMCHAEVVSRLLYNRPLLPEFEQYEIPWL